MTVYVDSLHNWGWVLNGQQVQSCHMVAETDDELHVMAEAIGMNRSWAQKMDDPIQYRHHYDLTQSRRKLAVEHGAVEIGQRELGRMIIDERRKSDYAREDSYD